MRTERGGSFNQETQAMPNQRYLQNLLQIEAIGNKYNLEHRFVGGTLTDLLNTSTTWDIDVQNRTVRLYGYTPPAMYRSDGTVKDVDMISFNVGRERYERARQEIGGLYTDATQQGIPFPRPSLEPTRRIPQWSERRPCLQIVSGLEEKDHRLYLTFDTLEVPTPWETVAPWKIVLTEHDDATITTLNPFAHALRYAMRVPSGVKSKDSQVKYGEHGEPYNKMSLMLKLGTDVARKAQDEQGIDYRAETYKSWFEFIQAMQQSDSGRIKLKATLTGKYWNGIGTQVAHGVGIFRYFLGLSDKFSG